MSGAVTAGVVGVVGLGMSAYQMSQQHGISHQAQSQSATVFGEQQQYAQMLQKLISDPSSVTSLPGYKFNQQQGEQAVARQMAGSGFLGSGNEAIALTKYGQDYATNVYQTQAQLLGQFAGLTSPVNPTQSLNVASGAQSASNQSLQQLLAGMTFAGRSGMFNQPSGGDPNYGLDPITPSGQYMAPPPSNDFTSWGAPAHG